MLPVADQVSAARASEAAETVRIRKVPRSVRTALLRNGPRDLKRIPHLPSVAEPRSQADEGLYCSRAVYKQGAVTAALQRDVFTPAPHARTPFLKIKTV